ncbi:uncharacterized protein [Watersipora subatra]|uniref:uncharacterized protein n=1 Tax=Watersipora subatra TaxID=2589382 RepID=UPI00355C75F3
MDGPAQGKKTMTYRQLYRSNLFFEYDSQKDTRTKAVIKVCKRIFGSYGIPMIVQSDNGPQFTVVELANFSNSRGFEHATSSLENGQSNWKAEVAVKIFKWFLR